MTKLVCLSDDDGIIDHYVLPEGTSGADLKASHHRWYEDVYKASWGTARTRLGEVWVSDVPYIELKDWFIQQGARVATDDEIELVYK